MSASALPASQLAPPSAPPPPLLPPLREDIKLLPGPTAHDGAPTWTLYDPSLHRYLRVGRMEFEILVRWGLGRPAAIAAAVREATPLPATEADVVDVLRFAQRGRLIQAVGPSAARLLIAEAEARKLSPAMWLLKNYLFIRVRLLDPDRFLGEAAKALAFVFTDGFVFALFGLALLGFYLIGRQWDSFTHSFLHMFSLEGAAEVGLALAFAKAIHEFGHGLMAKRMGCRVPGMGFALMVLWPMLWTDVTDSWRLTDRHKRLLIDAAGVLAEMTLAVAASLAWSVLPDGPLRSAAFMLASSTWLVTVAVNVSPLMRFDGYFLLSDWLNEPNLQERSFALGRWWLREVLFGFRDPAPERLPDRRRRLLIAYAAACWIYRFTLFIGIAVLVYHLAFKLLGIFLMAVEVGWFLARPIIMELAVWPRRMRAGGVTRRAAWSGAVFALLVAAFVLPWRESVFAPGLIRAQRQIGVIVPEPGQVVSLVDNGASVTAGQALFTLHNPDLEHTAAEAEAEISGLKAKLAGQAFDASGAQDLPVAWHQLEGAYARLSDAQARQAQMVVRAPFAGQLVDVPRDIRTGEWLPKREHLGILVDPATATAEALVNESDIARIKPGDKARFQAESGEQPLMMTVRSVSPTAVATIDTPELASIHGGGVPVRREQDGRLKPEAAVYRVVFALPDGTVAPPAIRRGTVRIEATPQSFADRVWRRAVAVVMREAGL